MSPHVWIGAQIFLDLLMVALLIGFLRSFSSRRDSWRRHEEAVAKAEILLREMREIGLDLDGNLREKKDLGNRILAQLGHTLREAEESYQRISAILPQIGRAASGSPADSRESEKTRASVFDLLGKGLKKQEVARHLGISQGEIDLIMKLWPHELNRLHPY